MSDPLHKFPSTPHLDWLSNQPVRGDKILTPAEVAVFLSNAVVIEEKIDGANLGISFDSHSTMRFQNRGNWIDGKLTGQWKRLRGWASEHEAALRNYLPLGHVLFGEWCFAKHSMGYDHLPDWFLAFDIYDSNSNRFWSNDRRNALLFQIGIYSVPSVACGRFDLPELIHMLDSPSTFGETAREGIYLRQETDEWLISRAKLVRPEFVQQIADHWSKGEIHPNHLATAPHPKCR